MERMLVRQNRHWLILSNGPFTRTRSKLAVPRPPGLAVGAALVVKRDCLSRSPFPSSLKRGGREQWSADLG